MGKTLERMLQSTPNEFEKYKFSNTSKKKADPIDYYNYSRFGNMLMRSQIDTRGKDANGDDIVFEIKTRAVAPI